MNYTFFILLSTIILLFISVILLRRLRNEEKRSSILQEIENKVIHYIKNIPLTLLNQENEDSISTSTLIYQTRADIAFLPGSLIIFVKTDSVSDLHIFQLKSTILQISFGNKSIYNEKLKSIDKTCFFEGKKIIEKLNDTMMIGFKGIQKEDLLYIKIANIDSIDKKKFIELLNHSMKVKV